MSDLVASRRVDQAGKISTVDQTTTGSVVRKSVSDSHIVITDHVEGASNVQQVTDDDTGMVLNFKITLQSRTPVGPCV